MLAKQNRLPPMLLLESYLLVTSSNMEMDELCT